MKALALIAAFACSGAMADLIEAPVVVQARHPGGAMIQLHEVAGPCVEGARLATYTSPDTKYKVNGCAKVNQDGSTVGIAWFDGDGSTIPMKAFKTPEGI